MLGELPNGGIDGISLAFHLPTVPFIADTPAPDAIIEPVDRAIDLGGVYPPLLSDLVPSLKPLFMRNSRAYEVVKARDWRGHFLASSFIVVCRKE
jgi:hypothetical protein